MEVVNTARMPRYFSSTLNHHLILAFQSLGVPISVFEDILRQRIGVLAGMCESSAGAIEYFRSIEAHRRAVSTSDCDTGSGGTHRLVADTDSDRMRRLILSMLISGRHQMQEPFIQASLRILRDREIEDLLWLRLPIAPAVYLMGIPDPSNSLAPDEVYLGRDGCYGMEGGKDVCITRFPLLRTESVRVLRVVGKDSEARRKLDVFFGSGTSSDAARGGVVVFSTHPGCESGMIGGNIS